MDILKVIPKQVYVQIEFSIEEVIDIVKILDIAKFEYDVKNEDLKKADETMRKVYKNFSTILKELEGNDS